MQRYVISRLYIDGKRTDRVMMNHTPNEADGVKYGRRIQKLVYGAECWRYAGQIVTHQDNLERFTALHGAPQADILKKTGIDLSGY